MTDSTSTRAGYDARERYHVPDPATIRNPRTVDPGPDQCPECRGHGRHSPECSCVAESSSRLPAKVEDGAVAVKVDCPGCEAAEAHVPFVDPQSTLRSRIAILTDEAVEAVAGARNRDYGDPRDDMAATAEMMNGYLHKRGLLPADRFLQPYDVPALLEMVKLSRLAGQPGHHDSMVDVIGWMGVYQECVP